MLHLFVYLKTLKSLAVLNPNSSYFKSKKDGAKRHLFLIIFVSFETILILVASSLAQGYLVNLHHY